MDCLQVFLAVVLGLICNSHGKISGTNLEVTVRPGQNVTVYCDCKPSIGVYIVWYRNCSHENQPTMVLNITREWKGINHTDLLRILPRFQFEKNPSSGSYDLLIRNITKSDEGLYYCGTEETQIVTNQYISYGTIYKYGKITTRIIINSSEPQCHQQHHEPSQDCGLCWILLFSLCPTSALLSSLLSCLVVCLIFRKKAKGTHTGLQKTDTRGQTGRNQAEDVCYAALEIHQPSQRQKRKENQRSDFSTYSAINVSGMQGD